MLDFSPPAVKSERVSGSKEVKFCQKFGGSSYPYEDVNSIQTVFVSLMEAKVAEAQHSSGMKLRPWATYLGYPP